MSSSSKQLVMILSAVAVIALGLYIGIFYYILSHHGAIAELESTLQNEKGRNETLQADKRLYGEFTEAKAELANYFVAREGEVAFIEKIESLGGESGVTLEVQNFTRGELAPIKNNSWELLLLQVRARGTWQEVATLLSLIETLPVRISITNVNLTSSDGGSELAPPTRSKKSATWEASFGIEALKAK